MGKYGSEIPEGDDRPPGMHDPLEYEDKFMEQLRNRPLSPLMGGLPSVGGATDLGQGTESLITLVVLATRGVFLLVTWPVRWAWRRRG